jgi:hypothetical protein
MRSEKSRGKKCGEFGRIYPHNFQYQRSHNTQAGLEIVPSLSHFLIEFPLSIFTLHNREIMPSVLKHVEEGTLPWFELRNEDKI